MTVLLGLALLFSGCTIVLPSYFCAPSVYHPDNHPPVQGVLCVPVEARR